MEMGERYRARAPAPPPTPTSPSTSRTEEGRHAGWGSALQVRVNESRPFHSSEAVVPRL